MSIEIHDKCFRAIRSSRFNWVQNPAVMLDKKLQTIGLNLDYLKKILDCLGYVENSCIEG